MKRLLLGVVLAGVAAVAAGCAGSSSSAGVPLDTSKDRGPAGAGGESAPPPIPRPPGR